LDIWAWWAWNNF